MNDNHDVGNGDEHHHYLKGLLAVPNSEAAVAAEVLGPRMGSGELLERLGGLPEENLRALGEIVDVFDVGGDPHAVAETLRAEHLIRASAVHGLNPMGHFRALSGEGPVFAPQAEEETLEVYKTTRHELPAIAVVDTGIVDFATEDYAPWMNPQDVQPTLDPYDFEAPDPSYARQHVKDSVAASHGTFVVSLLRRYSDKPIWLAAAKAQDAKELILSDGHKMEGPNPTSEFDVVAALWRLRQKIPRGKLAALNISMGAQSGSFCQDDFLLSVKLALAAWRRQYPDTPIFAAAGNSTDPQPVYPAAFEGVIGVAAETSGNEVVWNDSGTPVPPPANRFWVDCYEDGVGLKGLSGNHQVGCRVVTWGGSSFATAVYTAKNA